MNNLPIDFIKKSIEDANNLVSKLPPEISQKPGASSQKIRHLLNNLCSIKDARYLNVGVFTGSSLWSAIFNNKLRVTGIDWWRNGTAAKCDEREFWKNLSEVVNLEDGSFNREINIVNQDCFTVDLKNKYNIYLYDAEHSEDSQYKALTYFDKFLEDEFILLVDDFDDEFVKSGTNKAIKDLNYNIQYRWEGKGCFGDWNPASNHWWNGFLVALINKNK